MVGSFLRFLFTRCEESLTHSLVTRSFVCDSSQPVKKKSYALTNREVIPMRFTNVLLILPSALNKNISKSTPISDEFCVHYVLIY